MKDQHTPGPWTIGGHDMDVISAPDRIPIATIYNIIPRDVTEVRANARLIAAAPELLATLHLVEYILNDLIQGKYIRDGAPNVWSALNTVVASIAKTTGGDA